ncbi:MAG: DUF4268 domain-containing protein [Anaerolineales bacterium]|nr:DUF4268 domain-containing protein [Anaerolineales bacterium]
MDISRLTKVPLRDLWKHEAHGFTKWLADNLDFLSEKIGFQLTLEQQEVAAGSFSADIRAEDPQGNFVIIENQLEKTDHDHLGKLITYMSNLEAKTAIWITSEPRPEHEKAVHWLNETLPADTNFYLIKIEAYKIGNSSPAPHFTIVAGPSVEGKQIGEQKKELAERHIQRLDFWTRFLERIKTEFPIYKNISPSKENWIGTTLGKSGLNYNFVIRMEDARAELYIDLGNSEANKNIYDKLYAKKEYIERAYGDKLVWQRLDEKRASRVYFPILSGLNQTEEWNDTQSKMIEGMKKLQKVMQAELKNL